MGAKHPSTLCYGYKKKMCPSSRNIGERLSMAIPLKNVAVIVAAVAEL